MAVRCVFYTPGARETCQVLRLAGASPVVRRTRKQLELRYCLSGRFIACPIFNRVELSLDAAHRARVREQAEVNDLQQRLAAAP